MGATIGMAMTTWSTTYDAVDVLTLVVGTDTDRRSQKSGRVFVIDHMRTRFVRSLSGTICAFLAIKNFARIDA